jgi:hypothetical protein
VVLQGEAWGEEHHSKFVANYYFKYKKIESRQTTDPALQKEGLHVLSVQKALEAS